MDDVSRRLRTLRSDGAKGDSCWGEGQLLVQQRPTHLRPALQIVRSMKCHDSVLIDCQWHPLETSKVATCSWANGDIKLWVSGSGTWGGRDGEAASLAALGWRSDRSRCALHVGALSGSLTSPCCCFPVAGLKRHSVCSPGIVQKLPRQPLAKTAHPVSPCCSFIVLQPTSVLFCCCYLCL